MYALKLPGKDHEPIDVLLERQEFTEADMLRIYHCDTKVGASQITAPMRCLRGGNPSQSENSARDWHMTQDRCVSHRWAG